MQYFVALVYNYYIFKLYVILILYIYEMNKMDMPLIIENAIIKIKDMQKSIILDFYKKSLKIYHRIPQDTIGTTVDAGLLPLCPPLNPHH